MAKSPIQLLKQAIENTDWDTACQAYEILSGETLELSKGKKTKTVRGKTKTAPNKKKSSDPRYDYIDGNMKMISDDGSNDTETKIAQRIGKALKKKPSNKSYRQAYTPNIVSCDGCGTEMDANKSSKVSVGENSTEKVYVCNKCVTKNR